MADPYDIIAEQMAREQAQPRDPLDDYLIQQQKARAAAALYQPPDPEQAGAGNRLGRQFGLPSDIARAALPDLERKARIRRAQGIIDKYPEVGAWLKPEHAAIASDDLDNLERNARYWRRAVSGEIRATPRSEPGFMSWLKSTAADVATWIPSMRAVGVDLLPDWVRAPAPRNTAVPRLAQRIGSTMREAERALARADAAQPEYKSAWARGIAGGFSSVVQMVPGVGLSIAARNPAPAITMAGLQAGAPAYVKYRGRGGTKGEAALGAALEGGAEAAGELLPMKYVVDVLGTKGMGSFVAGFIGKELPSELATTIAQTATDTAIANPAKTWAEWANELPDALVQTALGTLVAGGVFGGLNEAARRIEPRLAEQARAADQAATLDALMATAAESKVRSRDRDAFAEFVDQFARNSPAEHVYFPADERRQYFGSCE